jgi:predicted DCC family thiol-disulfide oxidoreductase YuxK
MPEQNQDCILIYDGECRLCVTAKEGIERRQKAAPGLRYIPYQSEEAKARLGGTYKTGRPDAAFLVDQQGRIIEGLDAFVPLLPGLPGGRVMLALLRLPFGRTLANLAYRVVARNRYRWFGAV